VEAVERNLNAVRRDVGRDLEIDDKTRYDVVLTDPNVFREYSGAGIHVAGLFDGKIHIPIPSAGEEQAVQGVLWHEYTHAVIHTKARGRCPQWLNEGIASYQQSKIDPRRRENVRLLLQNGNELPLDWQQLESAFRSRNPDMQGVAYLQAFAVADFLFKRYRRYQINALLEEIGESGDAIAALKSVLHTTPENLERKVIEHIRSQ
ncbi:MAG: peptidase MA family metallohydrolase, partial [Candidatus Binatia bacterium]